MSATPSLQFMPLRSLIYFFIFDTTIKTSRSKVVESAGPPTDAAGLAVVMTWRRTSGVEVAVGVVPSAAARAGPPEGESGVPLRCAGALDGESGVANRAAGALAAAGTAGSAEASSACQAATVGDVASTAHASRWRNMATCESQHDTEQNTKRVRLRLHVDTEQTQWVTEKPMPRLHALHFSHSFMAPMVHHWLGVWGPRAVG